MEEPGRYLKFLNIPFPALFNTHRAGNEGKQIAARRLVIAQFLRIILDR
jgi:hypothetical protein